MTKDKFCEVYSSYFNEPVDNIHTLPAKQLTGLELFDFVNKLLKQDLPTKLYTKGKILNAIKDVFDIEEPAAKIGTNRYVLARKVWSYFLDKHTNLNLVQIAKILCLGDEDKPDHSGIIYYRNWVRNNRTQAQPYIDAVYNILENNIR